MTVRRVEAALMRGGTSRGVVMGLADAPAEGADRDAMARALIGRTAVDGLGGGTPITNKVVLVGRSTFADVDLDYIVGNVSSDGATVDWSGTCGNMTSAVVPFAHAARLIEGESAARSWVLRNLATNGLVDVAVRQGASRVPGHVVEVTTSFLDPGGAVLESTLPTGQPHDTITIGSDEFDASVVDVAHPYLLLRHEQVVGGGVVTDQAVLDLVERIRGTVCVRLGLCADPREAATSLAAVPRVVLVHRAAPNDGDGIRITAISMGQAIASVPVTAALALAAARGMGGTLVGGVAAAGAVDAVVSGPAGAVAAHAVVDDDGRVVSASVDRTAQILMQGTVWL